MIGTEISAQMATNKQRNLSLIEKSGRRLLVDGDVMQKTDLVYPFGLSVENLHGWKLGEAAIGMVYDSAKHVPMSRKVTA